MATVVGCATCLGNCHVMKRPSSASIVVLNSLFPMPRRESAKAASNLVGFGVSMNSSSRRCCCLAYQKTFATASLRFDDISSRRRTETIERWSQLRRKERIRCGGTPVVVFPGCVCAAAAAFSESSHNEEVKENSGSDKLRDWLQQNAQKRRQPVGERVLRMVAAASASPVAQYIASPVTPLHTLDPRVKQAWLLALVVLPSRSHISIRMGVIAILVVITIWGLPHHVWQDQLGRMAVLSAFLFVMLALGTDGVPSLVQTRTPPPLTQGLPKLPAALGGYKYVLMKLGPLQLTRKGVALAASASCLSFTVLQSASVCLATTTPEQLALALRWGIAPFAHIGAPVDELILTLLLSLRFIGLVFDEVRNIAMGVVARGIEWQSLRLTETADAFFTLFGRLFKNLFNHADQISQAMVARGYKGDPAKHHIYFLTKLSIKASDWVAIGGLLVLLVLSIWSEIMLPV